LCPLALGTQTTRSVVGPAAFCGVVGFKPSYGRIPTDGAIPLAPAFDTVGLFSEQVASLLLAAAVLVPDWRPVSARSRPVLGVPSGLFLTWTLEEGRRAFDRHVQRLEQAGYVVRRVPFFEDDELVEMDRQAGVLLHGEMARVHAPWYSRYASRYRPRTARGIQRGQAITDSELTRARLGQLTFRTRVVQLMAQAELDLWITPSSAGAAPAGFELTGWGGMTTAWSYAGLPCLSLPAGRSTSGLPLGLQCVGAFGQDERLLAWADGLARTLADC
jgi:Asp-tRNA(Asn)/Glu-tRNA(Gln) amidotransferase A subunit family amidase